MIGANKKAPIIFGLNQLYLLMVVSRGKPNLFPRDYELIFFYHRPDNLIYSNFNSII